MEPPAGGIAGVCHGETDEIGHKRAVDRLTANDRQTILALLGLEHTKMRQKYNCRNFRLTYVALVVVKDIIG